MPLQCIFMDDCHPIGSSGIHYVISLVCLLQIKLLVNEKNTSL